VGPELSEQERAELLQRASSDQRCEQWQALRTTRPRVDLQRVLLQPFVHLLAHQSHGPTRRRQVLVPQRVLHDRQLGAPLDVLGDKGVPPAVQAGRDPRDRQGLLDDVLDAPGAQPPREPGEEQLRVVAQVVGVAVSIGIAGGVSVADGVGVASNFGSLVTVGSTVSVGTTVVVGSAGVAVGVSAVVAVAVAVGSTSEDKSAPPFTTKAFVCARPIEPSPVQGDQASSGRRCSCRRWYPLVVDLFDGWLDGCVELFGYGSQLDGPRHAEIVDAQRLVNPPV
jgi:hypothetical protein